MSSRDHIDHFQYGLLVRRALRQMLAKVLREASYAGIPEGYCFEIFFRTDTGRSLIPHSLRDRYPELMHIALREGAYSELKVADGHFEVVLGFDGKDMRLSVEFEDIVTYTDQGHFCVEFDQFDEPSHDKADAGGHEAANVIRFPAGTRRDPGTEK